MDENVYGVFVSDGVYDYLVAAFDEEGEDYKYASERDELAYRDALDNVDMESDPGWPAFEGMHTVGPVARGLVDYEALERNIAQRFIVIVKRRRRPR